MYIGGVIDVSIATKKYREELQHPITVSVVSSFYIVSSVFQE